MDLTKSTRNASRRGGILAWSTPPVTFSRTCDSHGSRSKRSDALADRDLRSRRIDSGLQRSSVDLARGDCKRKHTLGSTRVGKCVYPCVIPGEMRMEPCASGNYDETSPVVTQRERVPPRRSVSRTRLSAERTVAAVRLASAASNGERGCRAGPSDGEVARTTRTLVPSILPSAKPTCLDPLADRAVLRRLLARREFPTGSLQATTRETRDKCQRNRRVSSILVISSRDDFHAGSSPLTTENRFEAEWRNRFGADGEVS